ncbi:tRNA/rRNA methyltransferase [Arsenophonus sp. aPb]|uniref:tRNA/rRNA methyltransferase n=1 Tax=Arsenophonus sp. aPb TaxID=3041619 RepID=UPI00246984DB|nr:tRNA/rRNA methyltransferase [Arsenophonus sp. aPb]WGL99064.1 tRNA/rRNA methyltransferase [Arsenophonus sp. aPb]
MNDSYSGKNGKVKVMYVRNNDNNTTNDRRKNKHLSAKNKKSSSRRSDRNHERLTDDPWKAISQRRDPVTSHSGISGKSLLDPEQIRRQRLEETRIYGEHACQAMFKHRPEAIVRAWFVQSITPHFRDALKWMAANRKAYHVVNEEELVKASGTEHHGGVCFLIKKRAGFDAEAYLAQSTKIDCVLAVEDIGNPHNLGAIMRSCAHFGVQGIILHDVAAMESGSAVRTAAGGAEYIKGIQSDNFATTLNKFRHAGYTIVTTSSHKDNIDIAKAELPGKTVLLLEQESDGLTASLCQNGDMSLSIGGTGQVKSLNVSVAAGIILAKWWQQNKI